jgi:hypothetical protein
MGCRSFLCALALCGFFLPSISYGDQGGSAPLLVPPLLGSPTRDSVTVNLFPGEKGSAGYLQFRPAEPSSADTPWQRSAEFTAGPFQPMEVVLKPLLPGRRYQYRVLARTAGDKDPRLATEAGFHTQRAEPVPFSFAILSDAHITPFHGDRAEVLSEISAAILARKPDFLFMLGDNIQTFTSHGGSMTEEGFGPTLYSHLRHALGSLPSSVPVFAANGNWEGENGWHSERDRGWAMKARRAFLSGPAATAYPEGGSANGDYYGFTWGSALFLVLNATGYTLADHTHGSQIGKADDWTLGEKQKEWLLERLSKSTARWKLLFIHHTVGGNAGDDLNSRYGRGGGRAAQVGEQALIHRRMREHGVQALFYGHDHVFTDMTVDGIHYTCVGSAGAPWKFTRAETGYERYWTPSGYTWVEVGRDGMNVSFVEPGKEGRGDRNLHSFAIPER